MAKTSSRYFILAIATVTIGIISGLGGMFLALFLHFIQNVAYNHTFFPLIQNHSFYYDVNLATPLNRVLILTLCGVLAGVGWWALFRYGKPLISIPEALRMRKPWMPIGSTLVHVFLQIITVALGSPLGREVAPRELAATFACWFNQKLKLHPKESQVLVACAAGAGLAAVYNVPLGGALFTLEVLLRSTHWLMVLPAITTSAIAVVVSWIGLGNAPFYHIPFLSLSPSLVIWSLIMGPVFGISALKFRKILLNAKEKAPKNIHIIFGCLLNFFFIGILSIYFPAILGNGRSAAQLGFDLIPLSFISALLLLIFRVLIVYSSFRVGAKGGALTPALAIGALAGVVLGAFWNFLWPGVSIAAYAVIGGTAFLAVAQKMPLTAIVLMLEFTGINFSFFIPILLAVMGALGTSVVCSSSISGRQ